MLKAAFADEEMERQAAVDALDLRDRPGDAFDRIVRLAASYFRVPTAMFTIIDRDRQWFKSAVGIDVQEIPRDQALCAHTILRESAVVVPDAAEDPRFSRNPLVHSGPRIRFYAGQPVKSPEGQNIGTLCLIDPTPRGPMPDPQLTALRDFTALLEAELLHVTESRVYPRVERRAGARAMSAELDAVIRSGYSAKIIVDAELRVLRFTAGVKEYLALTHDCVQQPVDNVTSFLDYPTMMQDLADAAAFGEPVEREVQSISGKKLIVQFTPFREPGATRYGIVVTFIDVSDRRTARKLTHIFNALSDPTCVLDASGMIVLTNESWDKAAAGAHNPLMLRSGSGARYLEFIRSTAETLPKYTVDSIRRVLRGELQEFAYSYRCTAPQQRGRVILASLSSLAQHGMAAVVTHRDVTDWVDMAGGSTPTRDVQP